MRRIVITGIGCVTPLGATPEAMWNGLTAGRSGVGPLTVFDASNYPVRIAAEVRNWDLSDAGEDPVRWKNCPRQTAFAVGAGIQAARGAGLPDASIDPTRCGVYLGCGEAFEPFPRFVDSIRASTDRGEYHSERFAAAALRIFDPDTEREYQPHTAARHLAACCHAHGPNANCISACASSAQAIGEAARMIRCGDADVMLAGGSHSTINPFGVTGFHRLSALSTRNSDPQGAARPFDRDRDGFVIGEGSAVFVLEDLSHALSRKAEIWGELSGYASAQDAYRVTDAHPDGEGTVSAIRRALDSARLDPDAIDYINAHGSGTVLNDKVETLAIKRVFEQHAYRVPVSSTKCMLGHATTACGAIELAVCLLALRNGVIPPTINYETPDPECDLDYVPNAARELTCRHILSTSVGFGGQNAALVVSRCEERSPGTVPMRRAA